MKEAAAEILNANAATEKSWASVFADLIKARLTTLVLLTTLVGFYLGWRGEMNFTLMFHALMGTALVAAGASALNQLLEREYDAKMRRTQGRPLPSGRMQPVTVMIFGGEPWATVEGAPPRTRLPSSRVLAHPRRALFSSRDLPPRPVEFSQQFS